jgi:hypothetical protein
MYSSHATFRMPTYGLAVIAMLTSTFVAVAASDPSTPANPASNVTDTEKLQQEIKDVRSQLPSQSHTMADVAYHFSNLWFAGQANNWPLAEFMLSEVRSHLRWSVRVRPIRPLSDGRQFSVGDMLTAVEQGALKELQDAVRAKDGPRFATSYKQMLASCYACHVAAEKPYLRTHIPERPADTMIEFDPAKPGSPVP